MFTCSKYLGKLSTVNLFKYATNKIASSESFREHFRKKLGSRYAWPISQIRSASVLLQERFRKNHRSLYLAFEKREQEGERAIKNEIESERRRRQMEKERESFIHETRIAVLQASSHVLDTFTHIEYRETTFWRTSDVSIRPSLHIYIYIYNVYVRVHRDASADLCCCKEYRKLRLRLFARICYYITVSERKSKRKTWACMKRSFENSIATPFIRVQFLVSTRNRFLLDENVRLLMTAFDCKLSKFKDILLPISLIRFDRIWMHERDAEIASTNI